MGHAHIFLTLLLSSLGLATPIEKHATMNIYIIPTTNLLWRQLSTHEDTKIK